MPYFLTEAVLGNDSDCVRLLHITAELCEDHIKRDTYRDSKTQFELDPLSQCIGNGFSIPEQTGAAGHIQPVLIHAIRLNSVGVFFIDAPGKPGVFEVFLIMGWDDDQILTLLLGLPECFASLDSVCLGFVVFGKNDSVPGLYIATDCHRMPTQLRVEHTFYRSIEVVHVRMKDHALLCSHLFPPFRFSQ